MVTKERWENIVESGLLKDYNYDSEEIREPLIEHIGHLPIIASYLHQFIENRNEVNLGRALTILSVHDIGETKVGDILTYSKPESHEKLEDESARKILPDYLYDCFKEYDEAKTPDAKFAKAVDSIAPLLHEVVMPKVTLERFKYHNFNTDKIIAKKREYFQWDAVLEKLFDDLMERFRQME
ncbi:MAG: HD domain-containing protein [Candidatus Pacebacteria bacterium]|nr:HD domain-containing protein [Candidatus Paceibacterota bacterium]MDR3583513.1 HD domain-containing protein [Candidatus Paceibacterota bacterium]